MNYFNFATEKQEIISFIVGVFSALLAAYSAWILSRYSRPDRTFHANAMTMKSVRRKDFLLSLIATYEPEVKKLLNPPPDRVIVAIYTPPEKSVPQGIVIARAGGQSREVKLNLFKDSPVRPLFEAILKVRLDTGPEVRMAVVEQEAHVG